MAQSFLGDLSVAKLPYDVDAEQSILGAILIDPNVLNGVMDFVRVDSFYKNENREIFAVMIAMFSEGEAIDAITVANAAKSAGVFPDDVSARSYITNLISIVPSTANVESYAKIVREKYYLRCLMNIANDIIENSSDGMGNATELLDIAEQRIFEIRQGRETRGLVRFDRIMVDVYDNLQQLAGSDRDDFVGISTGYKDLDKVIMGLNKSDLILLAARPAMGKTSFALNLAVNVAKNSDKAVAIFSLEMTKEQVASRMMSIDAMVSGMKLRTGELDPDEWVRLSQCGADLSKKDIYIDDSSSVSVPEMKAKLRRVKNLGLVVIDYLQLMSSASRSENRVQAISEITRGLKNMAKDLNVPVITLSQLSRSVESRTEHRPMLSDLRESGSIEQDADIVMFLYREAYYDKENQDNNISECIVAKNRHGEIGSVNMIFDSAYTKFGMYEARYEN